MICSTLRKISFTIQLNEGMQSIHLDLAFEAFASPVLQEIEVASI